MYICIYLGCWRRAYVTPVVYIQCDGMVLLLNALSTLPLKHCYDVVVSFLCRSSFVTRDCISLGMHEESARTRAVRDVDGRNKGEEITTHYF